MGDFHELVGDLTREQLNSDPYWCGVRVGKAARERDPRSWPQKLARSVGVHVWSCGRKLFGGAHLGDSGLTRDGALVYGRNPRSFDIFVYDALDHEVKGRAVALLLGLALVSPSRGDRGGVVVRSDFVNGLFAEGFADGFLRGDTVDVAELELAMRLSADVRSRVKDVLFGDGNVTSYPVGVDADGGVSSDGVSVLVAGSVGSGKSVALVDDAPVRNQFARPDMVLSLNGRTVEVYNPDGVPLSTIVDGRGVSLVNEATGERVSVPKSASRLFFVGGDVWYQRPDDGDPDLVFDNGWTARMLSSTVCYDCGAPVDVDGDRCDACEDKDYQEWASFGCDW